MRTLPLLALLLLATPVFAEPIVGRATVIDGDTLEVRGNRIRLHGVDAPESGQTSALAMADHISNRLVTCEPRAAQVQR